MAEDQPGSSKPLDPFESFRKMRDAYLDAMAKAMTEAVNTENYALAAGTMLDTSLTASAPLREAFEKTMLQVLQQLSLPSRQDIVALAERFTNFEMRLDDIDAKLDRIVKPPSRDVPIVQSEPAKPADTNPRTQRVGQRTAKAPAATKRTPAAKQAPPAKRTSRRGAR